MAKNDEEGDKSSENPAQQEAQTRPLGLRIQGRMYLWLARVSGGRAIYQLLVAAVLGVGTGYGALLFRYLIRKLTRLMLPGSGKLDAYPQAPWYRVVLPPAIGGLFVGPLVHFLAPEAKGHGVPEVKDACVNQGGRIRGRVAMVKTLASGVCIGSGGSVGREGPIVQIGASLGSALSRWAGIRGRYTIDFVAAGAAAGIAATFNAPLAGVMFAIEVILGRGSPRNFTPLVVAAVVATAVTHYHLGATPAFAVPAYALESGWELPLYMILGAFAAVVGVSFTRILYWTEDLWMRFPAPPYLHGVFGGLAVGLLALRFPSVLGVGYEHIEQVLGVLPLHQPLTALEAEGHLLILLGMKILATSTTIGSGGSGGIFAPSLFLGSCLGGAFGGFAKRVMPGGTVADPSAYALVAMGALVAATTHAPLTAILIVFELCDRHSIMLPLMLASIMGATLAMRLFRESIYTFKLVRRGGRLVADDGPIQAVRSTQVRQLMQAMPPRVRPNATMGQIVERAHDEDAHYIYVVEQRRTLMGVVTMEDVASHIQDRAPARGRLRARDLLHVVEAVTPETSLEKCLELLRARHRDELPVVDEQQQLLGRICRADVLSYYSREVLRQDAVLSLIHTDSPEPVKDVIALESGEVRGEIAIDGELVGKTLRQLNLRVRYGISVYAVKGADSVSHMPHAEQALEQGDTLFVIGPENELEHLRELAEGSAGASEDDPDAS